MLRGVRTEAPARDPGPRPPRRKNRAPNPQEPKHHGRFQNVPRKKRRMSTDVSFGNTKRWLCVAFSEQASLLRPRLPRLPPWVLRRARSSPRPPRLSAASRPSPRAGLREPVGSTGAQTAWPPALPSGGPGTAGLWGSRLHPRRPFTRRSRVGIRSRPSPTPATQGPPVPVRED